ncbi:hypothetical protein AB1P65_13495 [Roseibium alexandrii]
MPTVHGNEGSVAVGSDTVAKVQSFSLNHEAPTSPTHGMGDAWEENSFGPAQRWSGSVTAYYSPGDTGQSAISPNSDITLHLYPAGNSSGKEYYSGLAKITGMGHQQSKGDTVEVSFEFIGSGALTIPTVA